MRYVRRNVEGEIVAVSMEPIEGFEAITADASDLVEFGPTINIFEKPQDKRTEDYVSGHYG